MSLYPPCPKCARHVSPRVIDSRMRPDGSVWRRRECPVCKHRWTTYERVEAPAREPLSSDELVSQLRALLERVEGSAAA